MVTMVCSMTGYGVAETKGEGHVVSVEIKGVNSRFCEVKTKIPRQFSVFEEKINRKIKEKFARGYFEVYVRYREDQEKQKKVKVDREKALAYHKGLKELAEALEIRPDITIVELCRLSDSLSMDEDNEDYAALWILTKMALYEAIREVREMRQEEGYNLKRDIEERLALLREYNLAVKKHGQENVRQYRDRLFERIREVMDDVPLDNDRLATEVAIYADRADVTEETVRMESHLDMMGSILDEGGVVGRKMDFLVQEMHREVNTIGSKSNHTAISQTVVEMKSEIEKIREQVQNIE